MYKRKIRIFLLLFIFICIVFTNSKLQAQTPKNGNNWSKEDTENWYNGKQWLGGLHATPLKAIDKIEFARQYLHNRVLWDKAFAFLKLADLKTIASGKYTIDGENVLAIVTIDTASENSKWEAHTKYCDIQYVIQGKETMGLVSLSDASVITAYNKAKDVAFYETRVGNYYTVGAGCFLIFFPNTVHRPNLKAKESDSIKKIVIKVKAI